MMDIKYRLSKAYDSLLRLIARRLPRRLAYWTYIRVGVHATTGQYEDTVVPELGMMDALKRWDAR